MDIPIIPLPKHFIQKEGSYILTKRSEVTFSGAKNFAAEFIMNLTGLKRGGGGDIALSLSNSVKEEEGYSLSVDASGIRISARSNTGLFYGAQTFRQLLPPETETAGVTDSVPVPFVEILDAPRFSHRGLLLDVSRHFFDVNIIKQVLDRMAMLKLNRFHWHLTDSQGWRIESGRYPGLTEKGAKREGTLVYGWLWGAKYANQKPYEGYYTKDDIQEVVAYAAQRGIEVIPEIDLPGHCAAMLAAYPQLSCFGGLFKTDTGANSQNPIVCAGRESSYGMIFDILDEIAPLFPSRYFHIGADETDRSSWKKCPACRLRMKENGLKDERELLGYFVNRLAGHLKSRGFKVIVWNDGLSENTDKDIICQYWYGNKKETVRQVNGGRQAIYSSIGGYYLDYPFGIMGLQNSYEAGAGEKEFDKNGQENVIGVEAALWTEAVYDLARIDWQMYPRILAAAESAWTVPEKKDYRDFLKRVVLFEKRLDRLNIRHARREAYLRRQKTPYASMLRLFEPGEHPAMREYRKYNPVEGYNKSDGIKI
jgi:hexosaminidase